MMNQVDNINSTIHKEADDILYGRGVLLALKKFGTPHVTGSYALNLMTWRDLDIYLEANAISEENFFQLGSGLNTLLGPVRMSYRNERIAKTEGLPHGLYWGIYLGNERKGAWKIDVWALDTDECRKRLRYCADIERKLTPEFRKIIMAIKSDCWQDPSYRRFYTSKDVYDAVISRNVTSVAQFRELMQQRKAAQG